MNSSEDIIKEIEEYKTKSRKLSPSLKAVVLNSGEYKQYAQFSQGQCSLCQSEYRDEAEKLYMEIRKINPVKEFLEKKDVDNGIAPSWSWVTVDTHMKKHVDFTPISVDYMKRIVDSKEDYIEIEREPITYGRRMCLDLISELKSLDLSKRLDKMIEVDKTVNSLLSTYKSFTSLEYEIVGLRQEAETIIAEMANKFTQVMAELMEKVNGQENKVEVRNGIIEFQSFLKTKLDRIK
jgi:hypothetical protein